MKLSEQSHLPKLSKGNLLYLLNNFFPANVLPLTLTVNKLRQKLTECLWKTLLKWFHGLELTRKYVHECVMLQTVVCRNQLWDNFSLIKSILSII